MEAEDTSALDVETLRGVINRNIKLVSEVLRIHA